MTAQHTDPTCCPPAGLPTSCRVEAIVSVDDRGQMVLPKELREKAGIRAGDKLAAITWEKNGIICCISFMKTDNLTGMIKDILGPLMKDLV